MILHYTDTGAGEPIVLIHGMAASARYWNNLIPSLSKNNRVIAIDLLGFGKSPKPKDVTYDVPTHLASIFETLDNIGINSPFTLVGHSMGALLSLKLARQYPEKVNKLVLLGMPIYKTPVEAKQNITKDSRIREHAYYGQTSHALCATWCWFLRPLTKHVAPLYLYNQPKDVAQDSLLHTWQSYAESLEHVISNQSVEADLKNLSIPTRLIYGEKEEDITIGNLQSIADLAPNISVDFVDGGHNIGVNGEPVIAQIILQ